MTERRSKVGITARGPWPYTDPPRPWTFDKCKHWLLEICGNVLAKLISLCTFGYCVDLDQKLSKDIFCIVALVILLLRFMTTASLVHLQLCEMIVSPDSETVHPDSEAVHPYSASVRNQCLGTAPMRETFAWGYPMRCDADCLSRSH